jgi:hypothetical protein
MSAPVLGAGTVGVSCMSSFLPFTVLLTWFVESVLC